MLTIRDKMTLELEARRYKYPAIKDATIRETFNESPARYYQRLHALIETPDALAYSPVVVNRLRRVREVRRAALRA